MARVRFETGQVVNFEGTPSQADIDEVAKSFIKDKPFTPSAGESISYPKNLSEEEAKGGDVSLYQAAVPSGARTEVIAPLAKGASNYAFGVPKVLMGKVAGADSSRQIFADQETTPGKVLNIASEGAGYIAGGAGKLGLKMAGLVPSAMAKKSSGKILQGAIAGGVGGGTQLTPDEEGNVSVGGQVKQAVVGAGLGAGLMGAVASASKIRQSLNRAGKGSADFLDKVQTAIFNRKRQVIDNFGSDLENLTKSNPARTVSLRKTIDEANAMAALEPKLKSIIERSPAVKRLLDNPNLADNVPLDETQNIINQLRAKLPNSKKTGFNVTSDDIPVFDFIDNIKGHQLDAFPEMGKVKQAYGEMMNKYNTIKTKIKVGSLKQNLLSDFKGDDQVKRAFNGMLTEDILKEIKNYKNTNNLLKMAGLGFKTAGLGTAGGVGAKIGYDILRQRQ